MTRRSGLAPLLVAVVVFQALVVTGPAGAASPGDGPRALVYVQPQPSAAPGAHVNVVGLGFDAGQAVEVRWNGPNGQELAAAAGPDFTADVTVPAADAGLYTLVVLSRDANGVMGAASTTSFLVTGGGVPASGATSRATSIAQPTSAIPETGPTPAYVWAVIVFALLGLAVVLVWARRRQRRGGDAPIDGHGDEYRVA